MKKYSIIQLKKTLKKIGLKKNDNVFIFPELFRLGMLIEAEDKEDYYSKIIDTILEVVGPKGTIFINTYTFDRSRLNKDYESETSMSTAGALSNYFLKKSSVIRSLHPLFSVSGLGKNAKEVCSNNSTHNYGHLSPYSKMMKINTKILCLGSELIANPFTHVAEYFMGVPYSYNKIFKKKIIKNSKTVKKNFISFVRYMHLKYAFDTVKLKKLLSKEKKMIRSKNINTGRITICESTNYFNFICNILSKDIHGLLIKKIKYKIDQFPYI